MRKLLLVMAIFANSGMLKAQNDAMMQAFYWNLPVDEANLNGTWWDNLTGKAGELKTAGITAIWIPAPSKGNWGIVDMGYGIYDHYDLGNYYQKGTTETRFGSRTELQNMITTMHSTIGGQPKISVYADAVLNHVYSGDDNEEVNPAVKGYVFDEAYRGGNQYTPYPTNEIKWVIPNAGTGDYYIKIKGYYLDYAAAYTERAYDVEMDWTGAGFSGTYSWESEPNNGGGQSNVFPASGQLVRGFINYSGDIDEFKVTVNTAHDIVIKLTSRRQVGSSWEWADQTRAYYPFEIWHNGVNLATNTLQARTNTHITYVNHTGTGEANYVWDYDDFHPVDQYDFLTDWNWGGADAIIPNTKGFGNDFNTYSTTVQTRLNNWGYWMANQIGFDGFRLDFVRGFQVDFIADWINNLPLLDGNQRFIVGEYWGPDYRIKNWVNDLAAQSADADGFDFPLKSSLTGMCNGDASYDMRWLNHAGMVRNNSGNALPGTSVVTWLDNHDTGKEHDKWVTKDWKMGYAYILTHEGRPCIFYPHYYGVTLIDNHDPGITVSIPSGLKDDINKLLFARKTYLGGGLQVLSEVGNPWPSGDAYNVYVARRQGNGTKDGAIVVINNSNSTKGLWVDATPSGFNSWTNQTLKNAFTGTTTTVYSDGRVWVEAPARSYAVYVKSTDYVQYSALKSATGSIEKDLNPLNAVKLSVFPNPVTNTAKITFATMQKGPVSVMIFDHAGRNVATIFDGIRESGNQEFIWNPEGLSNGVYLAKIQADGGSQSLKIVVNK
ncbi:MAG: T9SS type A sorting domain-containing protein [Bacteroidales bacterium]|nr:T9SS type A sorting domain-containing protein [Bacteroidales bacterium]